MIVKIQRPITPPDAPLLIYSKTRDFWFMRPQTPELLALMGDRFKIYADATLTPDTVVVTRVRTDQDW